VEYYRDETGQWWVYHTEVGEEDRVFDQELIDELNYFKDGKVCWGCGNREESCRCEDAL